MQMDRFMDYKGRIKRLRPGEVYEEWRKNVDCMDSEPPMGLSFIKAVKKCLSGMAKEGKSIPEELIGSINSLTGSLIERGKRYGEDPLINENTANSWYDTARDPRRKANDPNPRENLYKICFLANLNTREDIGRFFGETSGIDAFARLTTLERCIERRVRQTEEGAIPEGKWFTLAAEDAKKVKEKLEQIDSAVSNGKLVLNRSSLIENALLKDEEFANAYALYEEADSCFETACARVEALANVLWKKYDDRGRKLKNSELIDRIFNENVSRGQELLRPELGKVEEFRKVGAGRNFPTGKLLGFCRNRTANPEQIRRMLILLVFALNFGPDYDRYDSEGAADAFCREANGELAAVGLRKLNTFDGYDVLILTSCMSPEPLTALRGIVSGNAR